MKRFYPNSWTIWLLRVTYLSILVLIVVCGIIGFIDKLLSPYWLILFIIGIVLLIFEFITIISHCIVLTEDGIFTKGEFRLSKKEKIQRKIKIEYSDIEDIKIISSTKNSQNSSYFTDNPIKPINKFLEIKVKNGRHKRLWINHYTKKQVEKLLQCLISKVKEVNNETQLNVEIIMKDWYEYDRNIKNFKN